MIISDKTQSVCIVCILKAFLFERPLFKTKAAGEVINEPLCFGDTRITSFEPKLSPPSYFNSHLYWTKNK